jgi:hypothetical protein
MVFLEKGHSLKTNSGRYVFDSPAAYQIRIGGHVTRHSTEIPGSMTLCASREHDKLPTTTLTGVVLDQAALMGILLELYEMHCTLLEVKRLPDPGPSESASSESDEGATTDRQKDA